ncbi:hypothetical protein E2L92_22040 [Salmonella enterica subsp. enterica serovar Ibadan]|nr:hypothetical protein [Salmonella enterica subsp. enterica serovar Ibadan]ECF3282134.1 hypothetical protein [Salmonella enterica subsp. enterica serovar Ibadan]
MAHTILEVKQAIQYALLNNASVAKTGGVLNAEVDNTIAEAAATIRVSELVTNNEVLGDNVQGYIASIAGRYGAFVFMIDNSQSLEAGENCHNIDAVANAGLFGVVGTDALNSITEFDDDARTDIAFNFDTLMNIFEPLANQFEAHEASQANEEALANGENITGDDEINYIPQAPIDGDAENAHDAATSTIRVNGVEVD